MSCNVLSARTCHLIRPAEAEAEIRKRPFSGHFHRARREREGMPVDMTIKPPHPSETVSLIGEPPALSNTYIRGLQIDSQTPKSALQPRGPCETVPLIWKMPSPYLRSIRGGECELYGSTTISNSFHQMLV